MCLVWGYHSWYMMYPPLLVLRSARLADAWCMLVYTTKLMLITMTATSRSSFQVLRRLKMMCSSSIEQTGSRVLRMYVSDTLDRPNEPSVRAQDSRCSTANAISSGCFSVDSGVAAAFCCFLQRYKQYINPCMTDTGVRQSNVDSTN